MKPFANFKGIVAPLDRANVDTDAIIPAQFLKSIKRSGFGPYLFDKWRYLDDGEVGQDCAGRPINSEFVLNQDRYKAAEILLARENFGCGSSREHAVWALRDYGIRMLIAPSFADIFYNNCFKNGLLPVVLSPAKIEKIFREVEREAGYALTVDLASQSIVSQNSDRFIFQIDETRKDRLINGLDDIDLTLQHEEKIAKYESEARLSYPWLFEEIV